MDRFSVQLGFDLASEIGDEGVRMPVTEPIVVFEQLNHGHVGHIAVILEHIKPVGHGMAILCLDGRKIALRALHSIIHGHECSETTPLIRARKTRGP